LSATLIFYGFAVFCSASTSTQSLFYAKKWIVLSFRSCSKVSTNVWVNRNSEAHK